MNTGKTWFAFLALAAGAALAQGTQGALGTVTQVQGLATVTTGSSGAAVAPGAPIVHGARVITTSTGRVTLRLHNGCTLTVPPGHAVTVLSTLDCRQLAASMTPVVTSVATATAPVATNSMGATGGEILLVNGLIVATGALIVSAIVAGELDEADDDGALSAQ